MISIVFTLLLGFNIPQDAQPKPLSRDDFNFGALELGYPLDSVGLHLPRPDSARFFQDDPEYVGSFYPGLVVWRQSANGGIAALDIYSPKYSTRRGLKVGDSITRVERLYGKRSWVETEFSRVGPYDDSFSDYDEATIFGGSYYLIIFTKGERVVKILSYIGVDE